MDNTPAPRVNPASTTRLTPTRRPVRRSDGRHDRLRDPALFAVASRPEVVSLAGGMPNISGLPLDVVSNAIGELIATNGPVALQYGSGQGDPRCTAADLRRDAARGSRPTPTTSW